MRGVDERRGSGSASSSPSLPRRLLGAHPSADALPARGHFRAGGTAWAERIVDPITQGAQPLEEKKTRLGQLHAPGGAASRPTSNDGSLEGGFCSPQVAPRVPIGPADLPDRLRA